MVKSVWQRRVKTSGGERKRKTESLESREGECWRRPSITPHTRSQAACYAPKRRKPWTRTRRGRELPAGNSPPVEGDGQKITPNGIRDRRTGKRIQKRKEKKIRRESLRLVRDEHINQIMMVKFLLLLLLLLFLLFRVVFVSCFTRSWTLSSRSRMTINMINYNTQKTNRFHTSALVNEAIGKRIFLGRFAALCNEQSNYEITPSHVPSKQSL